MIIYADDTCQIVADQKLLIKEILNSNVQEFASWCSDNGQGILVVDT